MKNFVSISCSVIAVGIAITALCNVAPSSQPLSWDYQGAIIGVLSLLVTALLGWQIFSVITVEKRIKRLSKLYSNISSKSDDIERKIHLNEIYLHAQINLLENTQYFSRDIKNDSATIEDFSNTYLRYLECLLMLLQAENTVYPAFCLVNGDKALSRISKLIKSGQTLDPNFNELCDGLYTQIAEHLFILTPEHIDLLHLVRARRKSLSTEFHNPPATNPQEIQISRNRVSKQ